MSAPIQRHHNDVNVTQTGDASGRGGASRQGAPDRHQATAAKPKTHRAAKVFGRNWDRNATTSRRRNLRIWRMAGGNDGIHLHTIAKEAEGYRL